MGKTPYSIHEAAIAMGSLSRWGIVYRYVVAVTCGWLLLGVWDCAVTGIGVFYYPDSSAIDAINMVSAAYQEGELRIFAEVHRNGMPRVEMAARSNDGWQREVIAEDYLHDVRDPSPGRGRPSCCRRGETQREPDAGLLAHARPAD